MRRNIEKIEIQDPPIQEISKKRSCLKRSCATGCGCIIIFLIASLILLKFVNGPRIKELKKVPDNFPSFIPLYDQDNITRITFVNGREKNRGLEIIAFVPKLVLSPIIMMLDSNLNQEQLDNPSGNYTKIQSQFSWNEWLKIIKKPVTDHRDIVQIEWADLPAKPSFLQSYYQTALKKNGFTVENIIDNEKTKQVKFSSSTIEGVLYIEDEAQKKGTDYFSLTINLPPENK